MKMSGCVARETLETMNKLSEFAADIAKKSCLAIITMAASASHALPLCIFFFLFSSMIGNVPGELFQS